MARALQYNLDMPLESVLVTVLFKFISDVTPKVHVDLSRAEGLGLIVTGGHKPHAEWIMARLGPGQEQPRPAGRHIPISRLFSGNNLQMTWLKDVFGDVGSLFSFLLIEVKIKGTLPASVPHHAVPKGKLINFCTTSHVHFDFEMAQHMGLVFVGGRQPYEWVRLTEEHEPPPAARTQDVRAHAFGQQHALPFAVPPPW